jgi:hypothetical protein
MASEAGGQVVQGVKRGGVVVAVHAAPQLKGLGVSREASRDTMFGKMGIQGALPVRTHVRT